MAKVAILVPYPDMRDMIHPLITQYQHISVMCVEYVKTEDIGERAYQLKQQGCELIVARGFQAMIVKRCVDLPLEEIRITAQELGCLILELRKEIPQEVPKIALIGFTNLFSDTSQFNELFHIDLSLYLVNNNEEMLSAVEQAAQDGMNAVIGGRIVCEKASVMGIKSKFLSSGEESLRNALGAAERACYAIDLVKRNSAEMDAMLKYTFSGIMQVNRTGTILRVNRAMFNLLEHPPSEILGKDIMEIIPKLDRKLLDAALYESKEAYAFLLDIHHKTVIVNIAPIEVNEAAEGAILTFQEGKRIIEMDSELRRELYQRGFVAKSFFDTIICESKETLASVNLAKRISKYSAPVLLLGEMGCGKDIMAQCIHNESMVKNNAFIALDCSAWTTETLDTMLFGNYYSTKKDMPPSMAELAQDGTLYLSHVEALSLEMQYKLFCLIQGKFMHNASNRPSLANVRIIVSTNFNLVVKVEKGEFRSDLYYALSVLNLELLPLRRRREDILGWTDFYLNQWQQQYNRYVHLTQGARHFMESYDWPGNLSQINSLCERIVLLAEKRNVDEVFVRKHLEQVTPKVLQGTEKVVLFQDKKAVQITELLRKHGGNRAKVAEELGVSKTTLWRYIKKYDILSDYSY
ncbi:sigma 54-interacting transcriptional regulator [Scatolibacter rhodanostii]|uniref:sigma 54-interacting transcriptional regulator n=1 Tax=Scatolibacter rhodanostii TaxID=2014781 RepID=UPI000C07CB45|nr:sigma 54-interacting transcriptional regulator [Scatolibacter rhodanostii]